MSHYYEHEDVSFGITGKQRTLLEKEKLRWENFKKSKDCNKIKKLRKKIKKYNKKIENLSRKNNFYL